MGDDNKPVAVDTEYHLNSRVWSNPEEEATVISNSFSSDLTELSQLKREQMHNNTRFKVMQSEKNLLLGCRHYKWKQSING